MTNTLLIAFGKSNVVSACEGAVVICNGIKRVAFTLVTPEKALHRHTQSECTIKGQGCMGQRKYSESTQTNVQLIRTMS